MPGSQREVENAVEEGVDFRWLSLPTEYIGNGKLLETKIVKMQLGSADESGRREPKILDDSEQNIKADLVVEALGFEPENLPKIFNKNELTVTSWGTLKINFSTMMTNIEGVFAAGDIVRGASLVVWGIKDGREAAQNIDLYLKNKNIFKHKHSNENNYEKIQ